MLRNLGTPIHCFEQLMRAIFLRSSLITTTASAQNLAPSRFDIPRGLATYGVFPKRRAHRAKGHMCTERLSTQTLLDILEVPQRSRTAGTYRRLAKLMAELGWAAMRVRDLTRGGI